MYAYINGKIADKASNYVVIDNNGIGYKIFMSTTAIEKLPEVGENQKIYTYYQYDIMTKLLINGYQNMNNQCLLFYVFFH